MKFKVLALLLLACSLRAGAALAVTPAVSDEDAELICVLDDGWRTSDATILPRAQQSLKHRNEMVIIGALWTVARLARPEAAAAVDGLQAHPSPEVRAYARVVAAELRAAPQDRPRDGAELRAFLLRVLAALNLTPDGVEAAAKRRWAEGEEDASAQTARWVVREFADEALAASRRGVEGAVSAVPVDLSVRVEARLKAEQIARPVDQRIPFLIDSLANRAVLTGDDSYLVQLLINEGPAARAPIIAKLEAMRRDHQRYANTGFACLFRALGGIGGPDAVAAVASFKEDPDRWVSYYARQVDGHLSRGFRRNRIIAY